MTSNDSSRKLAYVFSAYPALTEHFYFLETEGLRHLGWDVHLLTLRGDKRSEKGTEDWNVPEGYLHRESFWSWRMWMRALKQFVRKPLVLARLLFLFVRRLYSKPIQLTKTLAATAIALSYASLVEKLDVRIVHGPWGEYPSVAAFVIHKMCPQTVFTMALVAYDYDGRFALIPDLVEASKTIFVISEERKQQVTQGWPKTEQTVECVYHGVRLVTGQGERAARQGIISVARLAPYKGLHVLIEALSILQTRGTDFQAQLVGGDWSENPSYGNELRRQVKHLGLTEQVRFKGSLPHNQVLQAMAAAELFVMPSLYNDVIPNAVKEALSLKVPVIVTPTVGIGELVEDQQSGLIVPKDDPVALADAIAWALQNPKEMRKMATRGHSILADRFDIRKTSAQRSKIFEGLLSHTNGWAGGLRHDSQRLMWPDERAGTLISEAQEHGG